MNKTQSGLAVLIAALLAWATVAVNTQPPPTTTTTSTSTSTSTAPTAPPVSDSVRWHSPDASWNRPAADLGRSVKYAHYADTFQKHAGGPASSEPNVAFADYSVPIYNAKDATTKIRVFHATWAQQIMWFGPNATIGQTVPWNPTWKPGTGNDNIMIIVDEQTGEAWELGGIGQAAINCVDLWGPNARAGFTLGEPSHQCIAGMAYYRNLHTMTDTTSVDGRGAGIAKTAGIVRAEEVANGRIEHAMAIAIVPTMFGPECPADTAGAGTSCGFYVAPATKLERKHTTAVAACLTHAPMTTTERAKTIPPGMRFALDITDAQIETWLNERGYTAPLRDTARIFAVALRDYGMFVAETGCHGVTIETDGVLGPQRQTWERLGITPANSGYPTGDILGGLMKHGRLYTVNPPA